jgi:hypothetical protein
MAYVQIPLETCIFLLCLLVFGIGYWLGYAIGCGHERLKQKQREQEQKKKANASGSQESV